MVHALAKIVIVSQNSSSLNDLAANEFSKALYFTIVGLDNEWKIVNAKIVENFKVRANDKANVKVIQKPVELVEDVKPAEAPLGKAGTNTIVLWSIK